MTINGLEFTIENLPDGALGIRPHGYGDVPTIVLERWEGRLRVLIWPDRNEDEPTIIDMEGARE